MTYNFLPHVIGLLVFGILGALLNVWVLAQSDGDTGPPAFFSLICSLIGIVIAIVALVHL